MIRTLRVSNGSFANLGSVHLQPVASIVSETRAQLTPSHPMSVGVVPTHQATISHPIILHLGNEINHVVRPTLQNIGLHLTNGTRVIIPLHGVRINPIVPTYHLALDAGKEYDPRLNQGFVTTTKKFKPYESLTGIAQERPEIVMVTNFEPLFIRDVVHTAPNYINYVEQAGVFPHMTDAGRYLDAQFNMRNLRTWNTHQHVRRLRYRFEYFDRWWIERTDNFQQALNKLDVDSSFLLNLVRIVEAQKSQLDLRHDLYTVDPSQVGSLVSTNYVQQQTPHRETPLTPRQRVNEAIRLYLLNRHKPKYDPADVLLELGYTQNNVQNIYTSTKLWMQLMVELSNALKTHTMQFIDIDPSFQRNDNNSSTILNPRVARFSLSTNLPTLPPLTELISLQPSLAQQTINIIRPAFTTIYQNVSFRNEEARITALAHLLSSEFKYSHGLTLPAVQRSLSDYYGFQVSPGGTSNASLFDSIIGKFGNNISDFPSQASNALTSIAQQTNGQSGILTFESKYIEGDTGTLTPGSDFYFDTLLKPVEFGVPNNNTLGLKFNTGPIDTLAGVLENAASAFNVVVDGLNLMSQPYAYLQTDQIHVENSVLQTTNDLLDFCKRSLVDANGQTSQLLQTDRLAAVFAQARKDDRLKAALFMFVLSKVSRSYNSLIPFFASSQHADNTPLTNYLIDQVNAGLAESVPHNRPAVQYVSELGFDRRNVNSPFALNPQGIATALKQGTRLLDVIVQLMGQIIDQFTRQSGAIHNNYTLYNGYLDTAVMMVAFDLIVSMVARYGNLHIVGVTTGTTAFTQFATTYVVSQTTIDHRNSANELQDRALWEDIRVQQMILTIQHVLQTLGGSLKGVSNYLNSETSILRLREVAGILGNNQQMLSQLLSEQQIMLLASTVSNLLTAAKTGPDAHVPSYDLDTNDSEELKILDESDVPPAMRNAILGYFGTEDFASVKGTNKRILTVGVPQGFAANIKQDINIKKQQRASFKNRRNDIVQVCVYKVDMVNGDIVYKPHRYLFELSRFPVRVSTVPWLPLPANPALSDIINSIPTLNFSQNADTSTSTSIVQGIEYASATVAGNDGIKNARQAFNDDAYSFLSSNQKTEILHNHVVSQLLEVYIKLMTGLNVAEYTFDMAEIPRPLETEAVNTIVEHTFQHLADHINIRKVATKPFRFTGHGGVLFSTTAIDPPAAFKGSHLPWAAAVPQLSNPSGVHGFVNGSSQFRAIQTASPAVKSLEQTRIVNQFRVNLNAITPRYTPHALEFFRTITTFSNTLSSASDPAALNQKVVVPKMFDRVFNLIVDPTDFEVDVERTIATPYGREALDLMIKNGEIIPTTENEQAASRITPAASRPITPGSRSFIQGRFAPNVNKFRYRDRDVNQGDLIADKYFVTVETFDEEGT
jgi:hypothetical protein